jgi:hypothetical protein
MHYVNLIILKKVLLKFKHLKIETENTPFESNSKISENTRWEITQLAYTSAIGARCMPYICIVQDIM